MSDPVRDVERAAEREAETAQLYAPPLDDSALALELPPAPSGMSPVLAGFLTLLVTVPVCASAAGGMMALWHEITPIRKGFLAGLEEAILAVVGMMALSVFSLVSGIVLAVGLLGRAGKVSGPGWIFLGVLSVLAAAVCFLPAPPSTFLLRGLFGVICEIFTVGLTLASLRFARRRLLGLPAPPGP